MNNDSLIIQNHVKYNTEVIKTIYNLKRFNVRSWLIKYFLKILCTNKFEIKYDKKRNYYIQSFIKYYFKLKVSQNLRKQALQEYIVK